MKTILICGASGYVGSFLFGSLTNKFKVIGTSNSSSGKYSKIDFLEKNQIKRFLQKVGSIDILIFTIGLAHSKGKKKDYKMFEEVNLNTLKNILLSLIELDNSPEKIIFTSTISIYGEKMKTNVYHENSVKTPFSPYAITKRKAEKYLQKNYPNQSYILRLAPVYSPNFILNIKRRTKLFSFYYKVGNGGQKLSLCNIKNILNVTEAIIEEKIPAGVYNIADKCEYHYTDLLKYINAKSKITIPSVFIWILYYFGRSIGNNYLRENSIKLLSNNIYSIEKIRNYIDLDNTLHTSNDL